MPHIEVGVIFL